MAYNPKYDDIIDHPHHVPRSHPRMPLSDRAFQFAPFAALSGYADTIRETQRLTERKIELDEGTIEMLNRRCRRLMDTLDSRPTVSITYFKPDEPQGGRRVSDRDRRCAQARPRRAAASSCRTAPSSPPPRSPPWRGNLQRYG
ncbi:MAG: hypothetical protein ACLR4Z_13910 [Butyricicoccaceae bacterium]